MMKFLVAVFLVLIGYVDAQAQQRGDRQTSPSALRPTFCPCGQGCDCGPGCTCHAEVALLDPQVELVAAILPRRAAASGSCGPGGCGPATPAAASSVALPAVAGSVGRPVAAGNTVTLHHRAIFPRLAARRGR